MPLPTYDLPEPVKEFAENLILFDGVGTLEGMLLQHPKGLNNKWPPEYVMLARDALSMSDGSVLVDAHRPIPSYMIDGILDSVKTKLLDFILGMQENNITSEDLDSRTVEHQMVRNLLNVHIYGDNNVVASGENVNQHQEISPVRKDDVDSLLNHFRELGIDDDSLCKLNDAITSEPSAPDGKLGPKVSAWMGRMVTKAATKTWDVGIETASKVLMDALKNYYG